MLRVQTLEEELGYAKAEVRRLEQVELPAAFTEAGVEELRIPEGAKAARNLTVQGSLPDPDEHPEEHRRALEWWAANGYGDTIRCVVASSFTVGDRDAALAVYELLRQDNRAVTSKSETVHPMTLKAIVRNRIGRGEPTPLELLGCTVIRRVKLTTPPRRRPNPVTVPEETS
jgi:hypothetical protein